MQIVLYCIVFYNNVFRFYVVVGNKLYLIIIILKSVTTYVILQKSNVEFRYCFQVPHTNWLSRFVSTFLNINYNNNNNIYDLYSAIYLASLAIHRR